MKKRPIKRMKKYLGFGKKRRTEELIEKIISRLAKKGNLNVLIEILKIKNKNMQAKALSALLEQNQSELESINDLPDEIADFLQLNPKIEEQLWNKFSAGASAEELLCIIRFRIIFKQKAISLALKMIKENEIKNPYLRELLKEIMIFGDLEQRKIALKKLKEINLSSSDWQEIIEKSQKTKTEQETEELRELKRKTEQSEERDFQLLKKLEELIKK